jgi:hypothetical protein
MIITTGRETGRFSEKPLVRTLRLSPHQANHGYLTRLLPGLFLPVKNAIRAIPVGAAEGCDLLILKNNIKRSQPTAAPTGIGFSPERRGWINAVRQLLQAVRQP